MVLNNPDDLASISEPLQMPVSEMLSRKFQFSIPSYQRGYRWESRELGDNNDEVKQVDDILNDLTSFVDSNIKAKYYLQPLMVKPQYNEHTLSWDVLDGQQRLTTMLLVLKCLCEKLSPQQDLYSIRYASRPQMDFRKITYDHSNEYYDYPKTSDNLDSYYIRKAKNRIERWYDSEIAINQQRQDRLKQALIYSDTQANGTHPDLRVIFIWYNVNPIPAHATSQSSAGNNYVSDIELFNRLNRGQIKLTNSELIKSLFILCLEKTPNISGATLTKETLVRKWDEMEKKFQDDAFWTMMCGKKAEYQNRLDFLFDFICKIKNSEQSSYRWYYRKMNKMLTTPDQKELEELWDDVKRKFDRLCKWHENTQCHNRIGYLVEYGYKLVDIETEIENSKTTSISTLNTLIRATIEDVDAINDITYTDNKQTVYNVLLLFNVLTCDKHGMKFQFDKYRESSFDIEHINSQTDNPIEKIEDKRDWIINNAFSCLWEDRKETNVLDGKPTAASIMARDLIIEGIQLLRSFKRNGNQDIGNKFKDYRQKVESYYAYGNPRAQPSADKDMIGNLTLLNSEINREYKNALYPKKVRTIKRSDQEGTYIPECTKYLFLKYYSRGIDNSSAYTMMRWTRKDQEDYTEAIINTLKDF